MSESSYDRPPGYDQPSGYSQGTGYDQPSGYGQRTGWTGWIAFAAMMMIVAGSLNLFYGIVAAVNDEWVVCTNRATYTSTCRNGAGFTSSWAASCCSTASACSAAGSSLGWWLS